MTLEIVERHVAQPPVPYLDEVVGAAARKEVLLRPTPVFTGDKIAMRGDMMMTHNYFSGILIENSFMILIGKIYSHNKQTSTVTLEQLHLVVGPSAGDDRLLPPVDAHDLVLVTPEVVERRAARPPVPHLDEIVAAAADEELLARRAPVHAGDPAVVRGELAAHDHALLGPGVVEPVKMLQG